MSQANFGTPIQAGLSLPQGGNPYEGLATGGIGGLAASYGQSYNSALAANQQNYSNIIGGYNTLGTNIANTLGQGGGWGVAQPAAQAIANTYAQQSGGAIQNSINAGLGNSTAASAGQTGAGLAANQAYASLGSQLASTYAGYQANLGESELGFMNSVQIPYPSGQEYNQLYQQYGQQQATQQQFALQQQAQQQLLRSAGGRPSGSGVSTPQMPGISSAGRGGSPSATSVAPTSPYMAGNYGSSGSSGIYGNSVVSNPNVNGIGSIYGAGSGAASAAAAAATSGVSGLALSGYEALGAGTGFDDYIPDLSGYGSGSGGLDSFGGGDF